MTRSVRVRVAVSNVYMPLSFEHLHFRQIIYFIIYNVTVTVRIHDARIYA